FLGGLISKNGQGGLLCLGASAVTTNVPGTSVPGIALLVHPNPFGDHARLVFTLPSVTRVSLRVLDVAGRVVAVPLRDARLAPGVHDIELSDAGLAPGVYFCRLDAGARSRTVKLVRRN